MTDWTYYSTNPDTGATRWMRKVDPRAPLGNQDRQAWSANTGRLADRLLDPAGQVLPGGRRIMYMADFIEVQQGPPGPNTFNGIYIGGTDPNNTTTSIQGFLDNLTAPTNKKIVAGVLTARKSAVMAMDLTLRFHASATDTITVVLKSDVQVSGDFAVSGGTANAHGISYRAGSDVVISGLSSYAGVLDEADISVAASGVYTVKLHGLVNCPIGSDAACWAEITGSSATLSSMAVSASVTEY